VPLKNDLLLIKITDMNSKLLSFALITLTMLFMATAVAQKNEPVKVKIEGDDIEYKWVGEPKVAPNVIIKSTNDAPTKEDPYGKAAQSSEIQITKDCIKTTNQIEIKDESTPYYTVNEMPVYLDGKKELPNYVSRTAKYPSEAIKDKAQGVVVVQVIVEKDGSISNPKVVTSVHPKLDEEALRVVNTLKGFTAGKQNGECVRCYYQIPVPFVLLTK
jgi:protein TonB